MRSGEIVWGLMLVFALGACSGKTIGSNRAPVEGSGGAHADASVSRASTGALSGSSGSRTDASVASGGTARAGEAGGAFGGPSSTDGNGALGCDPLKCLPLDCPPERQVPPGPGQCCPACMPCGTGPCPPIAGPECPLGQGIGVPPGQCCLACIPIPPGTDCSVYSGLDAFHDSLGASLGAFSCNTADDCTVRNTMTTCGGGCNESLNKSVADRFLRSLYDFSNDHCTGCVGGFGCGSAPVCPIGGDGCWFIIKGYGSRCTNGRCEIYEIPGDGGRSILP